MEDGGKKRIAWLSDLFFVFVIQLSKCFHVFNLWGIIRRLEVWFPFSIFYSPDWKIWAPEFEALSLLDILEWCTSTNNKSKAINPLNLADKNYVSLICYYLIQYLTMPGLLWRGLVSCMLGIVRSGARVRCVYKMMDHQIHSVHLESFITVKP